MLAGSKVDERSTLGTSTHINTSEAGSGCLLCPIGTLVSRLAVNRDIYDARAASRNLAVLPHSAHLDRITKQQDGPYGGLVLQSYCVVFVFST